MSFLLGQQPVAHHVLLYKLHGREDDKLLVFRSLHLEELNLTERFGEQLIPESRALLGVMIMDCLNNLFVDPVSTPTPYSRRPLSTKGAIRIMGE